MHIYDFIYIAVIDSITIITCLWARRSVHVLRKRFITDTIRVVKIPAGGTYCYVMWPSLFRYLRPARSIKLCNGVY
jgi:hypothetical protein